MTTLELQEALKNRVELDLSGMRLKSSEGLEKPIQVFEQHLPAKVKSTSRNPESTLYPCVIVYMDEGERATNDAQPLEKVFFVIGVYDEQSDNQGYRDAMSIKEKLVASFEKKPWLNNRFEMQHPLKWKYNDEDTGPYYFVWIEAYFQMPRSVREDEEDLT